MKVLFWVLVAFTAVALADQILLWMERRGWIYWRRRKAGIGAASTAGMMGELHDVFSPTHRHVSEEKERRLVLREDAESGAPLDRRIDLESGRVVIHPGSPSPDAADEESQQK
ncbi:DUF6191 domain-containing protein [Streptomyces sp. NPDC004752]